MIINNKRSTRLCAQSGCRLLLSKHSSEASTIVWIAATFVIILIMMLYFILVSITYADKDKSETSIAITYDNSEVAVTKALVGFLESDVGNGETIYDLVLKADIKDGKEDEREKIFEDKATEFLQKNYALEDSDITLIKGENKVYFTENNFISDTSGEAGPVFSSSTKISLPILSDKQLKLSVYFG
ncbi:MAG: hypothetical protein AABX17_02095 [Nanoarchaeota archaeon]